MPRQGSIETKGDYTSNVAYYYQAMLVAQQAAALGKKQGAAKYAALAESVKTAFNRRFFDAATGRYATGSQTAQSLPLIHDLVPAGDRKRVLNTLIESVKATGNNLSAGFMRSLLSRASFLALTAIGVFPLSTKGEVMSLAGSWRFANAKVVGDPGTGRPESRSTPEGCPQIS